MRIRHAIAALLVVGCGTSAPVGTATVAMADFSIDPSSDRLIAGEVALELVNDGELPHTLVVTRSSGEVVLASDVVQAGESTDLLVRLDAGEYEFSCRIVAEFDGELFDHYELGMVTNVTVEG